MAYVPEKKLPNSFSVFLGNNPKVFWYAGSILFLLLLLLLIFPLLHTLLLFFTPLILSTSLCIFALFTIHPYLAATDAEVEREARLSTSSFHTHTASERKLKQNEKIEAFASSSAASTSSVCAWFNPSDWFNPSEWFNTSSSVSAKSFHSSSFSSAFSTYSSSYASAASNSSPVKSSGYGRPAISRNVASSRSDSHHLSPPLSTCAASASVSAAPSPSPSPVNVPASVEAPNSTWGTWMKGLNDSGKAWLEKKLEEEGRSLSEPADRETLMYLLQGSFAELVIPIALDPACIAEKRSHEKLSQIQEEEEEETAKEEGEGKGKQSEKERRGAMVPSLALKKAKLTGSSSDGGKESNVKLVAIGQGEGKQAEADAEKGAGSGAETVMKLSDLPPAEKAGSTEKVLEASRRIIDAVKVLGASEKHKDRASSILSRFRPSSSTARSRREAMMSSPAARASGCRAMASAGSPSVTKMDAGVASSPMPSLTLDGSVASSEANLTSLADLLVASPVAAMTSPPPSSSSGAEAETVAPSSSSSNADAMATSSSSSSSSSSSLPLSSSACPAVVPPSSSSLSSSSCTTPMPMKLPRKFLEESQAKAGSNSNSPTPFPTIGFGPVPAIAEEKEDSSTVNSAPEACADSGPKFDDDNGNDDGLEIEEAQALVRSEFKMLEMEIEEVASKLPKLDEYLNTYQKTHQPSSVRTPSKHSDSSTVAGSFASPTSSSLARSVRFSPLK